MLKPIRFLRCCARTTVAGRSFHSKFELRGWKNGEPKPKAAETAESTSLMEKYEDIIGLTAVREAQGKVIEAENAFSTAQELRRMKQTEMKSWQQKLKELREELDKTSRGEDRYIKLLTQEHEIIKTERCLVGEFQDLENDERQRFHRLSGCLRESHEKERERGERTKYWSIIGSVVGALIGIAGTTVNNRLRLRQLRSLVLQPPPVTVTAADTDTEGALASVAAVAAVAHSRLRDAVDDLCEVLSLHQRRAATFVTTMKAMLEREQVIAADSAPAAETRTLSEEGVEAVVAAVRDQEARLADEMAALKRLLADERGYALAADGSASYVGDLLDKTERNLAWKMKLQTLANVVLVYGALAVTVPILYGIFRGP